MAHTSVTKTYSQNTGTANTFSYSGSFDVFKASEVVVTLDGVKLTYITTIDNESASPRQYSVDSVAKTIHIGGANLSSGTVVIRPETDLKGDDAPTPKATFSAGSAVTSSDLNNNQLQLMRRSLEYDEQKLSSTGGTMTGDLELGQNINIVFEGATDDGHETTLTVADPDADRTITLPNVTGTVVTTGDTGTVTATMLAANSVDSSELVDGSIDTSHIGANQVTSGKLANDAVGGAQHADDAVDSEHYTDGSIDTAHIADSQVTADKLASSAVTTAKIADDAVTGAKIVDNALDSDHYTDGSIDDAHLATNSVSTVKIANDAVTIAKIGCEQTTISDSDSHLPTSGAVVDYVAAQIAPIGGLEVIADDASFPETQPASGVVISIADAGGLVVNGSGVSTTGDTISSDATVTINNINSSFHSTTIDAGIGMLVTSTGSGQIYNYHKTVIKESDVAQISDDINDFNSRYRIASSAPGSNNDEGDLYFDTSGNKMYVYDGSAWGQVTSTGEFKILGVKDNGQAHNGSGPTFNGSTDQYDLFEGTSDANITQASQLIVSLNGVIQKPNDGSWSGSEEGFYLDGADGSRFCDPQASGSTLFVTKMGSAVEVPTPADNSVTSAKIVDGTIVTADIADDAITEAKLATLGDVRWGDNNSVVLGAGSDGILFSDGSNGFYRTGAAAKTLTIQSGAGTPETIAKFIGDGAVELYHDNSKKVETDSTGITVFGTEGGSAQIHIKADEGDDNPDIWRIIGEPSGPQLNFQSYNSGSYTNTLRMTGDQGVDLYYNNGITFQTKAGGVKLNGHSEQSVNALGNTTGSTTINFATANIITATLTGATTFANPTTESVGQSGSIIVTQDGTGGRTLAWGTQFKWTGGTAPTLSTAANAVDRIDYLVVAADTIHCVASLDVK